MMNQRVSKGGHLVFKKRITIDKDKLLDKKGDRIVISKLDELHNKFIDKKPKAIEVVDEPITMPQNDEDYVPSSDFNEISDSYSRADSLMEMLNSLMSFPVTISKLSNLALLLP